MAMPQRTRLSGRGESESGRAVGGMEEQARPATAQRRGRLEEHPVLGEGVLGVGLGVREVGECCHRPDPGAGAFDRRHQLWELVGKGAEPAHAAIHLEVKARRRAGAGRGGGGDLVGVPDGQVDAGSDQGGEVHGIGRPDDEEGAGEALGPEAEGLLGRGDAEPGGAPLQGGRRGEGVPVTVAVGLDHGHDRDALAHHLTDHPEVVPDRDGVDIRPPGVLLPVPTPQAARGPLCSHRGSPPLGGRRSRTCWSPGRGPAVPPLICARAVPGRAGAAPGRRGASRRHRRPGLPPGPAPPRPGNPPLHGW